MCRLNAHHFFKLNEYGFSLYSDNTKKIMSSEKLRRHKTKLMSSEVCRLKHILA
ncbi:hypothetical protein RchiOBHm_Chr7g0235661 [Rosa chinensis]|uniref:Uncharacterized protein n=1 Tax=Rosa chinensis TaxID=74649 RepID=A0A2P6PGS5_ROSCH|nr:hypothetical protein RchiOBHm_Chr7g0235661 [Rosa chinensis]